MMLQKAMVIVGGIGSIAGSVIGATLLTLVLEALRGVKSWQEIAFGALLLGFIVLMPNGLADVLRRYVPGWREPLIGPTSAARGDTADASEPPEPNPIDDAASAPSLTTPRPVTMISRLLEGTARR
jgi:branched-chain amino acid transport system permease protein